MDAAAVLRKARRRAGLSQRALAKSTGVAQPTIARVERGLEVPRVDTLVRLLEACGESIEALPRLGVGVDRSLIREMLRRTPAQRLASLSEEAEFVGKLDRARRR